MDTHTLRAATAAATRHPDLAKALTSYKKAQADYQLGWGEDYPGAIEDEEREVLILLQKYGS